MLHSHSKYTLKDYFGFNLNLTQNLIEKTNLGLLDQQTFYDYSKKSHDESKDLTCKRICNSSTDSKCLSTCSNNFEFTKGLSNHNNLKVKSQYNAHLSTGSNFFMN